MKNVKILSTISIAAALAAGAISLNQEVTTNASQVQAASITLPSGYSKKAVIKWNQTGHASRALVKASEKGMKDNSFSDFDSADKSEIVNVTNLTKAQKVELSKYALGLINSARHQLGKKGWTYKKGALHFANRVASQYYDNNRSCWDSDHYVPGIERAAKASGLNSTVGQVYEDEAGLPITSEYHTNVRSMYALKDQIYFNVKQMLFGGYYGSDDQMNDASRYTEWEHAGDLLGCRTKHYDAKTKYFGLSFSGLKGDSSKISVHMMGVAKRYIKNYKKFNH